MNKGNSMLTWRSSRADTRGSVEVPSDCGRVSQCSSRGTSPGRMPPTRRRTADHPRPRGRRAAGAGTKVGAIPGARLPLSLTRLGLAPSTGNTKHIDGSEG